MRNWSNPRFDGTLEEAALSARQEHRNVTLIGMEVEGVSSWVRGQRRILKPMYDSVGFAPHVGDHVHVGSTTSKWRVVQVAEVNHRTDGRIEIRDENGSRFLA